MDQHTCWKRCFVIWTLAIAVGATTSNAAGQSGFGKFGKGIERARRAAAEAKRKAEDVERAAAEAKQKAEDAELARQNIQTSAQEIFTDPTKHVPALRQAELATEYAALLLRHYGAEALPLDLSGAATAARHAERAYRSPAEIEAELGSSVRCGELTEKLTAIQFYWLKEADRQVIAIRGTDPAEPLNLLADFVTDTEPDPISGIDAHEGFLVASQLVHASLLPMLDPELPILVTGHSLGGSIATLLGLRLQVTGFDVEVVTFGAPKVTTLKTLKTSPDVHQLPLRRFVNAGDAVPHFPVPTDTSGERVYAHFGAEWQLTAEGLEQSDLVLGLVQSVAVVTDPNIVSWSIENHAISLYREQLEKLAIGAQSEQPPSQVVEDRAPPKQRKRGSTIGGLKLPFGG